MNGIKGIIFDYGGTIDTDGTHWGEVIWDEYINANVGIEKPSFREAYVHGERTLAKEPIIAPTDTFRTLLEKKMAIQAGYLRQKGIAISDEQEKAIAQGCYNKVLRTLESTCKIVKSLAEQYPMVLVTNFYGNMPVVLKEFNLGSYFKQIVESSVVGIRKPDPALFALGVEALGLPADEIIVIGDSYRKDIYPALSLGCKAVWIKNRCWENEETSDNATPTAIIETIEKLPALLATHNNEP